MNIFTFTKEGILFASSMAAVVFAVASLLTGCGGAQTDTPMDVPAGTMLVDYYRAVKASAGGDGYTEMVLYKADDSAAVKLCVYSKEEADSDEICTEYIVPYEAAERCFEIIEKHRLGSWNGMKDAVCDDGAVTVCKYYDNGGYIRVSTEEMPQGGEKILEKLAAVMAEYATEEYILVSEADEDTEVKL